jgi:hypothetical protein
MGWNRIFSISGASKQAQAVVLHCLEAAAGDDLASAAGAGSFMAIAMPVWPVLAPQGLMLAPPVACWQIQQQTFQRAFEQARALLSPPRHARLLAASWN